MEKKRVQILQEIDPNCISCVRTNGTLIVKLEKALYGCKQSAKLWYDRLSAYLMSIGFVVNTIDKCVFNKDREGHPITIVMQVDDFLYTSKKRENLDWLRDALKKEFEELTH